MAGSKTAYLSQKLLDHALGGSAYTPVGTVYLALSTAAFSAASTGSAMTEVAASGYARLSVSNNSATWSASTAAAPSEKHNNNDLLWAVAAASWGTPSAVYICDALTGGNALYGADITNPQTINSGDTAKIAATVFVFTEA